MNFLLLLTLLGDLQGREPLPYYDSSIWEQGKKVQSNILKNSVIAGFAGSAFHASSVFIPFALEKDGYELYTGEWHVIIPICLADIGIGTLGGILSGVLAKSWVKPEDSKLTAFFKGTATGLLGGVLWGTAIGSIWSHNTKKYDCEYSQYYDLYALMSIYSGIAVSGIGSGTTILYSRWNIWSK
ncbi:MAG: hypothetical protein PHX21_12215 [bacterium]|nr:hypothetical protein [bacterium]